MRRNAHRRNEPEPETTSTTTGAPLPPSAGPVEPVEGETVDVQTGEEIPAPKGPLSELQDKVRTLLDYDQIAEIRLALSARSADLEKHVKKAGELGVREEDARRRIRLIHGSDTRFGLLRIFAPEEATEQTDVFFDPENPNGRPGTPTFTVTFRTPDGEEITLTPEQLGITERVVEVRELHAAGMLPADVEHALRDGGFWHLVEDGWDEGAPGVTPEGADRLASAAGV